MAKVVQDYAATQGVHLPSLSGKERTMNDTMPGAFGKNQSSHGFGGLMRTASSVLNGGGAGNNGFNDYGLGGGAGATAATAAGFAGMSHFADRGERHQQQGFGRSNSFGGDGGGQQRSRLNRNNSFGGNNNGFSQQQQQGFGQQGFAPSTPQGFGPNNNFATPGTFGPPTPQGTPGFGQGAPAGFNNQAYPPAYSVMDPPQYGFSGAMTTQGQPYGVQQGWGQQQQQPFASGYGQQSHQRGASGGGWGAAAAGGLAAAGLGAGLASTYNSAFGGGNGGGGGYGYPTGMQQGYHPAAAYGGPALPPNPGKQGKKKNKDKNKSAVVTEQPQAVPMAVNGWLHMPPGYELPDGIPKGLEVGSDGVGVFIFVLTLIVSACSRFVH